MINFKREIANVITKEFVLNIAWVSIGIGAGFTLGCLSVLVLFFGIIKAIGVLG